MAKADKEKCPKCYSDKFAVSANRSQTRHCDNCRGVWLPMSLVELKLLAAQEEITKLKASLADFQKLVKSIKPEKTESAK